MPEPGTSTTTGIAAATGGRDGPPGDGLSAPAAEFLYRLAGDADDTVRQITACQQVLRQYADESAPP